MGILKVESSTYGDMTNAVADYSINSQDLDGATGEETSYICDFSKWNGYYKTNPVVKSVIDKKALYTVGKGYKVKKDSTKQIIKRIKGFGKDTFNSIMFNAVVTYTLGGDFFAEIIRDSAGRIINLKPLNPSSIRIIANGSGIITRYEQINGENKPVIKFKPKEIFHLCWNRVGDEIHGVSTIEKIEDSILKYEEAKSDLKKVFHRYVKPIHVFKLDTDDPTEIASFKQKADKAVADGENLFIPKDAVDMERVSIPQYSTLDPLPWILQLEKLIIMAEGVPAVVLGDGGETTEASSKILYLAFQQMVEWNQLFLEDQIEAQLGLEIEFEFPASIEPELQKDEKKDKRQTEAKGMVANKDE